MGYRNENRWWQKLWNWCRSEYEACGAVGIVAGSMLAIFLIAVVGLVIWLIFVLFTERSDSPEEYKAVEVVGKHYFPPTSNRSMIMVGKVMVPQTRHVPARYSVVIVGSKDLFLLHVDEPSFQAIQPGQRVSLQCEGQTDGCTLITPSER